ncbi:YciI family protein [Paenibacillus sp. NPDC055715]
MYIVSLKYVKPLNEVERYLEEHVKFLDKHYQAKNFVFSGRKVPRTGGVILVNVQSKDVLENILNEDPFYMNQIAEYEITQVEITKCDELFRSFLT